MGTLKLQNSDLDNWLSESTLKGFRGGEFKRGFQENQCFSYLVIDNFLRQEVYIKLAEICQKSPKEKNRSEYGLSLGRDLNWGYFPDVEFLRFIFSRDFLAEFQNVVGEPVKFFKDSIPQLAEFLPGSEGFAPHTDYGEKFDLVSLLYFSSKERPVEGGAFCIHGSDGSIERKIKPLPNRFVFFKISKNSLHSVEDIGDKGGPRLNLTIDWVLPQSQRAKQRGNL